MAKKLNIYIVIPAFNEQANLPQLLKRTKAIFPLKKVIVVDDGSEPPLKIPSDLPVSLIRHHANSGKGSAMRTGIESAFAKGADAVIFMDADGQHDPNEIPKFIAKLISGYDIVFGARMMPINTPIIRFIGNKISSLYVNLIYGVYLSDILSGFRGMTRKAYRLVRWESSGYSVETEMIARMARKKGDLKYTEFPILGIYLDANRGMTLYNAFQVLYDSIIWKIKFAISDFRP